MVTTNWKYYHVWYWVYCNILSLTKINSGVILAHFVLLRMVLIAWACITDLVFIRSLTIFVRVPLAGRLLLFHRVDWRCTSQVVPSYTALSLRGITCCAESANKPICSAMILYGAFFTVYDYVSSSCNVLFSSWVNIFCTRIVWMHWTQPHASHSAPQSVNGAVLVNLNWTAEIFPTTQSFKQTVCDWQLTHNTPVIHAIILRFQMNAKQFTQVEATTECSEYVYMYSRL